MKQPIKVSSIYSALEQEAIWKVYDMSSSNYDPMNEEEKNLN